MMATINRTPLEVTGDNKAQSGNTKPVIKFTNQTQIPTIAMVIKNKNAYSSNIFSLSDLKSLRKTASKEEINRRLPNFVRSNEKKKTVKRNEMRDKKHISFPQSRNPLAYQPLNGVVGPLSYTSHIPELLEHMFKFVHSNGFHDIFIMNIELHEYICMITGKEIPINAFQFYSDYVENSAIIDMALMILFRYDDILAQQIHTFIICLNEIVDKTVYLYEEDIFDFDQMWFECYDEMAKAIALFDQQPTFQVQIDHISHPQSTNRFDFSTMFSTPAEPTVDTDPTTIEMVRSIYKDYKSGRMKDTMAVMTDLIKILENSVENIPRDEIKELTDTIKGFIKQCNEPTEGKNNNSLYAGIIIFCACSLIALKFKTPVYIFMSIVSGSFVLHQMDFPSIIKKFNFMKICFDGLTKMIQKFMNFGTNQPQSADNDIREASECISLLYSFVLIGTSEDKNIAENIYKKINLYDKCSNNLGKVIKLFISMAERIYNAVLEAVSPKDKHINYARWLRSNNDDIESFIDEADLLIGRYYAHTLVCSPYNSDYLKLIRKRGIDLIKEHNRYGRSPLPTLMNPTMAKLNKISERFAGFDFKANGIRIEPAMLCLIGGAGIGKSILNRMVINYLAVKLVARGIIDPEILQNIFHYVYNRKSGVVFWEGHNPKTFVVSWDDINQQDEEKQTQGISEPLEIIHSFNMENFDLNMAFEQKGQARFSALLGILSTNVLEPKCSTINCKDAFFRRLNKGAYILYPADKYCTEETRGFSIMNRKLNIAMLDTDEKGDPIILPDVYLFQRVLYDEQGKSRLDGAPFDFFDIMKMTEDLLDLNIKQYEQQIKVLARIREIAKHDADNNISIITHRGENLMTGEKKPEEEVEVIERDDQDGKVPPLLISKPQSKRVYSFNPLIHANREPEEPPEQTFDPYAHVIRIPPTPQMTTEKVMPKFDPSIHAYHPSPEVIASAIAEGEKIRAQALEKEAEEIQESIDILSTSLEVSDDESFEEYVQMFGLQDQDREEMQKAIEDNIKNLDLEAKFQCRQFVERVKHKNKDFKPSAAWDEFYYELREFYKTNNFVDHRKFGSTTPTEVFLSYFEYMEDDFIKICKETEDKAFQTFLIDLRLKVFEDGFHFDRKYHKVIIPDLHETAWCSVKRQFREWKEFLFNVCLRDSWVIKIYNNIKTFIYDNPVISFIIASSGIIGIVISATGKLFTQPASLRITTDVPYTEEVGAFHEAVKDHKDNFYDSIWIQLHNKDFTPQENLDHVLDTLKALQDRTILEPGISEQQSVSIKLRSRTKHVAKKPGRLLKPSIQQCVRGLDPNGNEIMYKRMLSNSYTLRIPEDFFGTTIQTGAILFIKDFFFIMDSHYIATLEANYADHGDKYLDLPIELLQCNVNNKKVVHKTTVKLFLEMCLNYMPLNEDGDVRLYYLKTDSFDIPLGVRSNLVENIATEGQHEAVGGFARGVLLKPGESELTSVVIPQLKRFGRNETTGYTDDMGRPITIKYAYQYPVRTEEGDCGSILALDKARMGKVRIFGMHVSGNEALALGYSEPLFREKIEKAMELLTPSLKVTVIIDQAFNDSVKQNTGRISSGQFEPMDILPKPVTINTRTTLMPSRLMDSLFEHKEMPAILKKVKFKGVITDPWEHNLQKMCKGKVTLSEEKIQDICEQMLVDLEKFSDEQVDRRVLTVEEAILGEDHFELGSIPRDTSPGYPHVLNPIQGLPKRTRWFGKGQEYSLTGKHYQDYRIKMQNTLDGYIIGLRDMDMIAIDNLKDETIAIQKIAEKLKARIFSSFPIEKQTIDKQYFGAFVSWMTKNRIKNGNCVGMNPYSTEWDLLARKLLRFGNATTRNVGATDHKTFDGNQNAKIHRALHKYIIEPWYKKNSEEWHPDHEKIRYMSMNDIADSIHLRGDKTYRWTGGLTSGAYLTILINFLYNMFNFYHGWYNLHDYDLKCLPEFKVYVELGIVGDDNVFSVDPCYTELFTPIFLKETSAMIGLEITSETKEEVGGFRMLSEVGFLKRSFAYDPALKRYICPMELEPTIETLYWTRRRDDADKITCDNVDFVLKELSMHGQKIFEEYSKIICQVVFDELSYTSEFSTYRKAFAAILDSDSFF